MSNLPKGWKEVKLGEIGESFIGLTYSPSEVVKSNGILVLRSSNIQNSRIELNREDNVYVEKDINEKLYVKEGDILICARNGSKHLIGKNALITKEVEGSVFGAFMSVYRSEYSNFIFQLLQTDLYQKQINNNLGATINQITSKHLNSFKFPFPPLEEQKKIADILSTVDKKIAFVEENINATEELKKGLMQKLLTEGIGHTEFKDSELGRIPESWKVKSVGKMLESNILSSVQDGNHGNDHPKASDYVKNGVPFVMANDIKNGKINYNDCKKISEEQYNSLRIGFSFQNDILLTHKATIGLTTIVKGVDKIMLTPQVTAYRIKNFELLFGEYLFYYFQSQYFQKLITMLSKQSTRSYIGITAQKKLLITLPPLNEQKKIAEILSTVDQKLEVLKGKKESFEELKKGLMQKLLTGEVRV